MCPFSDTGPRIRDVASLPSSWAFRLGPRSMVAAALGPSASSREKGTWLVFLPKAPCLVLYMRAIETKPFNNSIELVYNSIK